MANITNLQTVGDIYLCWVDANPAAGIGTKLPNGDPVPAGSLGFYKDAVSGKGIVYLKTAASNMAWAVIPGKAGIASKTLFTGTPKKLAITFDAAFPDANYAVSICGEDARAWTYENKTATGFTINTNANKDLDFDVDWSATYKWS